MSSVFARYESEFNSLMTATRAQIHSLSETKGDKRPPLIAEGEKNLTSARETLEQMELEIISCAKQERSQLQTRVRTYKAECSALQRELTQARIAEPRDGEKTPPELASEAAEQRARLLATTERERSNTNKLREAQRTLQETEGIGSSILADLRSQRETLMHSMGTLRGADEMLSRSKRVLTNISRRALANKLIMSVMILILVCAILALAYLELFGTPSGHADVASSPAPPSSPKELDANQRL